VPRQIVRYIRDIRNRQVVRSLMVDRSGNQQLDQVGVSPGQSGVKCVSYHRRRGVESRRGEP